MRKLVDLAHVLRPRSGNLPKLLRSADKAGLCKVSRATQLNPLPGWGKCWRDFEKEGDWRDALYPIGNGVKQAIEKARLRSAAR